MGRERQPLLPVITAVVLLVVTTGCRATGARGTTPLTVEPVRTVSSAELEVLREIVDPLRRFPLVAAPDGTLFLATQRALFRALPAEPRVFEVVVERFDTYPPCERKPCMTILEEIYAVSADTLFGVNHTSVIYRWEPGGGFVEIEHPLSDSAFHMALKDIHGTGGKVFVVGADGRVLTRNGEWSVSSVADRPKDSHLTDLFAVGGTMRGLYAAGFRIVRIAPSVQWLKRPRASPYGHGIISFVADNRGTTIFGNAEPPQLLFLDGSRWRVLDLKPLGVRYLEMGEPQPDGTVLAWGYGGVVVEIDRGTVRPYRIAGARSVIAAASTARHLYVLAEVGDNGVLARFARD